MKRRRRPTRNLHDLKRNCESGRDSVPRQLKRRRTLIIVGRSDNKRCTDSAFDDAATRPLDESACQILKWQLYYGALRHQAYHRRDTLILPGWNKYCRLGDHKARYPALVLQYCYGCDGPQLGPQYSKLGGAIWCGGAGSCTIQHLKPPDLTMIKTTWFRPPLTWNKLL